jgi:divalent metal cation (Fe/Co/Zn/Cd) transporter
MSNATEDHRRQYDEASTGASQALAVDALKEIAAETDLVGGIHDVRVREADAGEVVNFHCVVDAGVKVADVHERVDEMERALRLRFPPIKRVIGHAEPASKAGEQEMARNRFAWYEFLFAIVERLLPPKWPR